MKLIKKETLSKKISLIEHINNTVQLNGMIQNLRILGWGGFIILRTVDNIVQCVVDKNKIDFDLSVLKQETPVQITGKVTEAKIKDPAISPNNLEIQVENINIIHQPKETLPIDISKKELDLSLDTKFDFRPITLRHPKEKSIFKISSVITEGFSNYLKSQNFTQIYTPKIVFSGAEGGANIFEIEYFEKRAYLAQSPQFYKQMGVGIFERVFEIGPVYRAEKHSTSRHLNEYISLDFEMGFINSYLDIIQMEINTLDYIFNLIKSKCNYEINLLKIKVPEINDNIPVITLSEVHEIIKKEYKQDFTNEPDLTPIEERLICEYSSKEWDSEFVFVTHFPSSKRPFYTMDDPENPEFTLSFDLLFRGLEITTGSQRLHVYDDYVKKMKERNMNIESFEPYLQIFKYGMPPHGGLAIGLERLTSTIIGLENVKQASMFPRDINRLTP